MQKGKGKNKSESIITAKKWTPLATQRPRKPQNYASIQGEPTLITHTGKITVINPVVNSKGKFPKDSKQKDLGIPRNQLEERTGLFRYRRPGFGQYGEMQDIEGNHSHTPILPSNETETSNQKTGKKCIKYCSSTNS
ncbi:hypothetical protein O181_062489 [Austropuccinia psidii MF-1]|uniref:Uncharacterized protein n=1 Tax=Austropuccinia psidii MF-1 TaxID=1389203 RepID=A0A9Q3I1L5_9BASI|nr:hypothetical protein [Austropuccinia psidii MF-1]